MFLVKIKIIFHIILGNIHLESLSPKKLRKRYICSNHFDDTMYMNSKRMKLKQNAIPNKYLAGKSIVN